MEKTGLKAEVIFQTSSAQPVIDKSASQVSNGSGSVVVETAVIESQAKTVPPLSSEARIEDRLVPRVENITIAVMGPTGVGKSSFVKLASGCGDDIVGQDLASSA